jgi:hypothetical protein
LVLRLRGAELEWREVEGQLLALDLRESRYVVINRTGRTLWNLLIDGATRAQLIDCLVEEHRVDRETAGKDVDAFLADLKARNLLAPEPDPSAQRK